MRPDTAMTWLPSELVDVWPRWATMWLVAGSIFFACKLVTWTTSREWSASLARHVGYFLAWPGLDADAFLSGTRPQTPALAEWLFAFAKALFGVALVTILFPRIPSDRELVRGWVGMIGFVFALHFGLFQVLSVAWRSAGVNARPNMNWPILATSVSDFWGRRWNTAFRDLTHRFLFRPFVPLVGVNLALAICFLFSGLIHDVVITLPAGGGYGGPTAYFLIQAAALGFERCRIGRDFRGRIFTMLVLVGPLPLLFPSPFVHNVFVPFLDALQRITP